MEADLSIKNQYKYNDLGCVLLAAKLLVNVLHLNVWQGNLHRRVQAVQVKSIPQAAHKLKPAYVTGFEVSLITVLVDALGPIACKLQKTLQPQALHWKIDYVFWWAAIAYCQMHLNAIQHASHLKESE